MTSRQIAPITLNALRHLRLHGVSSLSQLKSTLPELQAKTMNNLVQLGHAMRTEAGYMITPKGKARLQQADSPPPAQPAGAKEAGAISNRETDQRILDCLRRADTSLTLREISAHTALPLNILRPSLTTLVQAGNVIGTTGKPSRYRLAEQATGAIARRARENLNRRAAGHAGARDRLGADDFSCPELQRNPGIGAERFVAFQLPSRIGQRLHWPDGRVTPFEDHPGLPA